MRFVVVLVASALVAACGSSRSGQTPEVAPRSVPVEIPRSIGPFHVISVAPVQGGPLTDTLYRFRDSTGFRISVIRFPIRDDVRQGRDTLSWLTAEGNKFAAVQALLRDRSIVDSFTVRLARTYPPRPGVPAEHINAIQTWSRRGTFIEVEHLYIVEGRFLKVRGSEPDREYGSSPTSQFSSALIRRMTSASAKR